MHFLGRCVKNSWWVFVFFLVCTFLYAQASSKKNHDIFSLQCRQDVLLDQKQLIKEEKKELKLRIQSQSDPAWMEIVLIKELGVVPEGCLKVHFVRSAEDE